MVGGLLEGGELFVSGDLTPCFDGGLSVFFSTNHTLHLLIKKTPQI